MCSSKEHERILNAIKKIQTEIPDDWRVQAERLTREAYALSESFGDHITEDMIHWIGG